MERRRIANTDLEVSPVALGCWPIAGVTSINVNDADSLKTIEACFDLGINFLDTAYCYGADGQSERLIAKALGPRRKEMVIATKGGIHWDAEGNMVLNGRPETLRRQCDESLRRLQTEYVELLYLHGPDPEVPIAESAGELKRLMDEGKARYIGASNVTVEQLDEFQAECPVTAVQPPYNILQRQIEDDLLPWCAEHNAAAIIYWPLMKGLLAGKLARDHVFDPRDGRAKYPMFHGEEWEKNQDFVDKLREIAAEVGKTVAQVVINWTIHQPDVTVALCGAKRDEQIQETAGAIGWKLSEEHSARIDKALEARGTPIVRSPV